MENVFWRAGTRRTSMKTDMQCKKKNQTSENNKIKGKVHSVHLLFFTKPQVGVQPILLRLCLQVNNTRRRSLICDDACGMWYVVQRVVANVKQLINIYVPDC